MTGSRMSRIRTGFLATSHRRPAERCPPPGSPQYLRLGQVLARPGQAVRAGSGAGVGGLGPGGLNGISSRTLHEQLSELGLIAGHDPGRYTRRVREGGRLQNILHLLPGALEG